jgi:uncharacterized protein YdiU (UPF0061 family)
MNDPCGFQFASSYLELPTCFYSQLKPVPVQSPAVVIVNDALAQELGLDFSTLNDSAKAALFSGNELLDGGDYYAQAYAGHQFGHFTLLGDGRALMWGEHITPDQQRVDIQFKGSGQTPYSRRGDGRAALEPMLREYILSEAIHYLGIPTTRSLAVVTTGETVLRDEPLPGAILTRVASSHVRVGTFEFAATQAGDGCIQALLDYTLARHYPELVGQENPALALLQAVSQRQVDLVVHWMRVGFIHGVMNTDNTVLSGETIDYGPCAFMDEYDPQTVFSSIDRRGRYAYQNQPGILQWNLARLAETLLPLIAPDSKQAIKIAEEVIQAFADQYEKQGLAMMRNKLGLLSEGSGDSLLIKDLLAWMQQHNADYTNTFRDLSQDVLPAHALYDKTDFQDWYARWQARLSEPAAAKKRMRQVNPAVIPRNHQVQYALTAATAGDLAPLQALLAVLRDPYNDDVDPVYQALPTPSERVYQTFCGT